MLRSQNTDVGKDFATGLIRLGLHPMPLHLPNAVNPPRPPVFPMLLLLLPGDPVFYHFPIELFLHPHHFVRIIGCVRLFAPNHRLWSIFHSYCLDRTHDSRTVYQHFRYFLRSKWKEGWEKWENNFLSYMIITNIPTSWDDFLQIDDVLNKLIWWRHAKINIS